jgi:transcription termination/antitermination protein NusA
MSTAISANKMELIAIADAVAREKSIDRMIVIDALEEAIQKAARARYGNENEIRAKIDPKTGELRLWRILEVMATPEDMFKHISVVDAQSRKPGAQVGDYIIDPLPPMDFGRIASQTAKQVIVQKVRDAERQKQFEEFKDRKGEIVTGIVKRTEFGHVVLDLGKAEGVIRRDQLIPREQYRLGDRVRAYVLDVRRETRGPQIFLSRTAGGFMAKLFEQEVPEVYEKVIEIKATARDPGSRAKIGVFSRDSSIDPVGACVGMRGSRVQAVVQEMQGEKIDIIPWSPDPATFIVNALQPAEVAKVVLDEEEGRIEVVVPDDQLSLAIGRRGQNVRLASQLTGWQIDIITETAESERRQQEFVQRSEMFQKELDVDETLAQLLVAEGFTALEEVAYVDLAELAVIEGFDETLAQELQNRASEALERQAETARQERVAAGVDEALAAIEGLTEPMLVALGKAGIKTLDDLGDLATDELVSKKDGVLRAFNLSEAEGNRIIMAARAHWFEESSEVEA